MATKLYDLAVKTGVYIKDGQEKNRYENIGSVMQGDNGQFIILKRTFNPAGVINPENKDSVLISCFEPRQASVAPNANHAPQQQQAQSYPQQRPAPPQGQPMGTQQAQHPVGPHQTHGTTDNDFDDDIPF